MSTETDVKLARYSKVEREADELGRVIGVRRLKPSEQVKVVSMTAELSGHDEAEVADPDTGDVRKVRFPHRMTPMIAAAVCEIDEVKIPFPKTRGELDAILDRLDAEGIGAAGIAFNRMVSEAAGTDQAEAKN